MTFKRIRPATLALALVGLGAGCGGAPETDAGSDRLAVAEQGGQAAEAPADGRLVVYKSPTCGCCKDWIEHMEENGFTVEAVNVGMYDELVRKKHELGVPDELGSCHTGVIDGYVVEGHVPADAVKQLLEERPDDVKGLAVPGMPIGSPGMEGPNPEPYDIVAFDGEGNRQVYRKVDPTQPPSDSR